MGTWPPYNTRRVCEHIPLHKPSLIESNGILCTWPSAKFGPWLALRAVIVLDDVEGPPDAAKPTPPGNPLTVGRCMWSQG